MNVCEFGERGVVWSAFEWVNYVKVVKISAICYNVQISKNSPHYHTTFIFHVVLLKNKAHVSLLSQCTLIGLINNSFHIVVSCHFVALETSEQCVKLNSAECVSWFKTKNKLGDWRISWVRYFLQCKLSLIFTCPALLASCLQLWVAAVSPLRSRGHYSALKSLKQSERLYQNLSGDCHSAQQKPGTCCQWNYHTKQLTAFSCLSFLDVSLPLVLFLFNFFCHPIPVVLRISTTCLRHRPTLDTVSMKDITSHQMSSDMTTVISD